MKRRAIKRHLTKRQVVVIHGGDSFRTYRAYRAFLKKFRLDFPRYRAPQSGWKKTLDATLGRKFEVIQPDMPNKLNAKYAEWKIWFEKFIPYLNKEVILVGHSLGALFLVKYLSENRFLKKIRATFLVAPPWSEGDFYLSGNFGRFTRRGGEVFIYQSEDDRVVRFVDFKKYRAWLPGATTRIFRRRGHFNQSKFPELVRDIRSLY
jgi:serine hydrolase